MEDDVGRNQRLSGIATHWTVVRAASHQPASSAREARRQILNLYGGAAHRYLLGALRNEEAADDLFQEFASRFLEGRMGGADPQRGRFRDYVKGILFHMIVDHQRARGREARRMAPGLPEVVAEDSNSALSDQEFTASWREEVLSKCWDYLEQLEQETGRPFYSVLRYRTEHPEVPSHEMALRLESVLKKPFTAAAIRQLIHRAREKFSDYLLETIVHSLESPSVDVLEQELIELGLREYCRSALGRWRAQRDDAAE